MNPELNKVRDDEAAAQSSAEFAAFLREIGLSKNLRDIDMNESEITKLADQCMVLPDYEGNPRVATRNEMIELVKECF